MGVEQTRQPPLPSFPKVLNVIERAIDGMSRVDRGREGDEG